MKIADQEEMARLRAAVDRLNREVVDWKASYSKLADENLRLEGRNSVLMELVQNRLRDDNAKGKY